MALKSSKFGTVTQNVIIGTVTGIMVGYNLKIIFAHLGGVDLVWMAFFVMGPLLGYVSGKERQRVEKLKKENAALESNMEEIQKALKQSTKKYKLLVEQANDAIYLTSSKGRLLLFNSALTSLSGYGKNELKQMNIDQLKADEAPELGDDEAWLDNGVYRYEETWKKKSGAPVAVDINARWIQLSEHRLILHIARDVQRQKDVGKDERSLLYQEALEFHIRQNALFHEKLFHQLLDPMYETIRLLKNVQAKYPQEAGSLNEVLKIWDSTQKNLMELSLKNDRDKLATPSQWELNDMLHQELVYLDTLYDSKTFRVKTSFSKELPKVFGFGRDYSLALGTVFRALAETMVNKKQKGLLVSTRCLQDEIFIEIMAPGENNFKAMLSNVLDPFHEGARGVPMGADDFNYYVLETIFKAFDGQLGLTYQEGKGTVIRIRIPAVVNKIEPRKFSTVLESDNTIVI